METKIFYSWQSDLLNNTNRTFIEKSIENVAESIQGKVEIADRPIEIDYATKNVVGTVNIADSIFKKIEQCQIFVADISIIGKIDSYNKGRRKARRKTPNPNVLIELGYAIKHLGESNVLLLMNTAYGSPEDLPFDLRMKNIITYKVNEDETDKFIERKNLEKKLEDAIELIVKKVNSQVSLPNYIQEESVVDSFLINEQKRLEQEKFDSFRAEWFSSGIGLRDVTNFVNQISILIDKKYSLHEQIYLRSNITINRKRLTRILENPEYGCKVELKNYENGTSLDNIKPRLFLEISLYRKGLGSINGFLKTLCLYPDIDFSREVLWIDSKDEATSFNAQEICDKCFEWLITQIKNSPPELKKQNEDEKELWNDIAKAIAGTSSSGWSV